MTDGKALQAAPFQEKHGPHTTSKEPIGYNTETSERSLRNSIHCGQWTNRDNGQ
jgi:hypothetical protein